MQHLRPLECILWQEPCMQSMHTVHYYSELLPHWDLKCHNLLHHQSMLTFTAIDFFPPATEVDCVWILCKRNTRKLTHTTFILVFPCVIQSEMSCLMSWEFLFGLLKNNSQQQKRHKNVISSSIFSSSSSSSPLLLRLFIFNSIISAHSPSTLPVFAEHRMRPQEKGDLFFN